jgi:hypothetical protein
MNSDVLTPDRPRSREVSGAAVPGTREQPTPQTRRPARPARRPRPGWPAQPAKSPVRPASPARPPGPGRSGRPVRTSGAEPGADHQTGSGTGQPSGGRPVAGIRRAGQVSQVRRTSFVLLLLGLLGGGLVCLLVVNTTLAANSINITNLEQANTTGTQQVQQLQQQVAIARSAGQIEKEARRLGLRPDPAPMFVNLRTGSIQAPPGAAVAAAAAAARAATTRVDHGKSAKSGRHSAGSGSAGSGSAGTGSAGTGSAGTGSGGTGTGGAGATGGQPATGGQGQ